MEAEYPLEEEVGQVFSINCRGTWHQVPLLGHAVDDYPDGVTTIRPWKSNDEVHTDVLP